MSPILTTEELHQACLEISSDPMIPSLATINHALSLVSSPLQTHHRRASSNNRWRSHPPSKRARHRSIASKPTKDHNDDNPQSSSKPPNLLPKVDETRLRKPLPTEVKSRRPLPEEDVAAPESNKNRT
ncbi:Uncharacterized protein Rs2_02112 [Raphanus sativus]|nr:Uncharacterized protein Rs2_02112 [Raphanus sativus]